jgi:hypothetical protein
VGRVLALAAGLAVVGVGGCASTWDDVTSRRVRDKPASLFKSDDPLHVLRSNPDGSERAKAMAKLKEPLAAGRPEAEQEEVLQLLADAATADPSPWVRMSAVNALGRFRDPRTTDLLVAAYHQADGRPATAREMPIQLTAARGGEPAVLNDRLGLHGPQGFHADQAGTIRGLALDNLARRDDPKVVDFLARVAAGEEAAVNEDPVVKEFVRQRAVASLGKVRTKEAVVALAKVLAADGGKDVTITHLAHGGLVGLTGLKHPPDPATWNEVVQTGFEIAPPPSGFDKTLQAVTPD